MLLVGATPAQSKANLMQWLDATIQSMTKYDTLVYAGGQREWGFFHQILSVLLMYCLKHLIIGVKTVKTMDFLVSNKANGSFKWDL